MQSRALASRLKYVHETHPPERTLMAEGLVIT